LITAQKRVEYRHDASEGGIVTPHLI
jgi:hypothetical protein